MFEKNVEVVKEGEIYMIRLRINDQTIITKIVTESEVRTLGLQCEQVVEE